MTIQIHPKDYNQNGIIDNDDIETYNGAIRNWGQMAIAWVSLIAIIVLTVILCTDLIPLERVKILEGLFTTVYIALSSLVGAQMGLTAWMRK